MLGALIHKTLFVAGGAVSLVAATFSASASAETYVGNNGVTGYVTDLFANTDGLMIRIETNKRPLQCIDPPNGWMIVPRNYNEMSSVILSHWLSGKRQMTIFTAASQNVICSVNGIGVVN